jgi:ABC-type nitrate/sulfonate/bicarbonate transport system substrate-binding protein
MGGAGAGAETSDALFLGALDVALAAAPLVAALAARVSFLFFTIVERIRGRSKNDGGGATVLRKKDE